MGKPTGFLEYERETAKSVEPKERICNYNEFHTFLSEEEQREIITCGIKALSGEEVNE